MEVDNIIKLVKAVSDSSLTNFVFEEGEMKVKLSKNVQGQVVTTVLPTDLGSQSIAPQAIVQNPAAGSFTQAASIAAPAVMSNSATNADGNIVKSSLVGVFYSSASPDSEPFVSVGSTVKKGQVLGIVEAMKLMNEIESDYDGIIEEVYVNDGDMVEFGQPLFRVK